MGLADEVRGASVVLRRYRVEDADDVAAGCDDPLSQRFLPRLPSPYTRADALDWITVASPAAFADGGAAYAIADPATDRVLGGAGLTHDREKTAVIGYWVAPWARGRGVATAAARTLTGLAFSHGVDRLSLRTEWENTSSQRVAIAAGFVRECVQRAGGLDRSGDRHDLIVWTRLRTDPDGPSHRLLPDLPTHRERGDGTGSNSTDLGGTLTDGALTDGVVTLRPLGLGDADDLR
jgi:RimJ/RimL family protein N-acetyltransferase